MDTTTTTNEKPPLPPGRKQWHKTHRPRIHHNPELAKPVSLDLIHRRLDMLMFLDQRRFATNRQVAERLFALKTGSSEPRDPKAALAAAGEKCLLRAKDCGLIERIPVFHRHHLTGRYFMDGVNILTRVGARMVEEEYERRDRGEKLRWSPDVKRFQHATIDHDLEITDATTAIAVAVEQMGGEVLHLFDDDQLLQAKSQHRFQEFTPDAFMLVALHGHLSPLFLEIDRGTEVVLSQRGSKKDIKTKVERYGAYFRHRYGGDPFFEALECLAGAWQHPLVLTITTSQERLENMLKATEAGKGKTSYWYTTRPQAYAEVGAVMGAIWRVIGPEDRSLAWHLAGPS